MIRPIGDRVVVKKAAVKSVSEGGIFIPESSKSGDDVTSGEVIAVGSGYYQSGKLIKLTVSVGDTIIFKQFSGNTVVIDSEEYIVLHESDILVVTTSKKTPSKVVELIKG